MRGHVQTELELKEQVFESMREARAWYLEQIREQMRKLYHRRARDPHWLQKHGEAFVHPDDARRYFEEELGPPPPEELSRNFLAAVFQTRDWHLVKENGWKSSTPNSHRNSLNTYAPAPVPAAAGGAA